MTTKPRILDLNNFEDFKTAAILNLIHDYTKYIEHTPNVTPLDDEVYERRRYLLQENIALEQIVETATEDEQIYIINKHDARKNYKLWLSKYYKSWLSSSGRVRRSLASNGYFPEILINDESTTIRCDVVEQHPEYLPKLFHKEITKREWRTIVDVMWKQKQPNYKLLKDLLSRNVPQELYKYTYERLDDLKEKFTAMDYVLNTIEKTMTTKQRYQQNNPAWKQNCSAEEISTIHLAEDYLTSIGMSDVLRKYWPFIINGDETPPFTTLKSRIHSLIAA